MIIVNIISAVAIVVLLLCAVYLSKDNEFLKEKLEASEKKNKELVEENKRILDKK